MESINDGLVEKIIESFKKGDWTASIETKYLDGSHSIFLSNKKSNLIFIFKRSSPVVTYINGRQCNDLFSDDEIQIICDAYQTILEATVAPKMQQVVYERNKLINLL